MSIQYMQNLANILKLQCHLFNNNKKLCIAIRKRLFPNLLIALQRWQKGGLKYLGQCFGLSSVRSTKYHMKWNE